MVILNRTVERGVGDFKKRMTKYSDVFRNATGEVLEPGTINVNVGKEIKIEEHFRIRGVDIGEPRQDLKFEICRINGIWAYRIRPYTSDGGGGHGDHVLEIACSVKVPDIGLGSSVKVALFRAGLT